MEEQTRVGRLADAFTTAGGIQDRRSRSRALLSMGMLLLEAGKTVEAMKLVEFIPFIGLRARIFVAVAKRKAEAGEPMERSEEHTSELQSLMRISYAVFCLKKKKQQKKKQYTHNNRNTQKT